MGDWNHQSARVAKVACRECEFEPVQIVNAVDTFLKLKTEQTAKSREQAFCKRMLRMRLQAWIINSRNPIVRFEHASQCQSIGAFTLQTQCHCLGANRNMMRGHRTK